jgi:hypothetical protein
MCTISLHFNVNSSADCDKNVSQESGYFNVWKTMDPNKRNELIKSIRNTISQSLNKSRGEYIKWFQNPLTINKFKTSEEQMVLKKIPSYLQSINRINIAFKGSGGNSGTRAWVNYNAPNIINYNLSQLHNGDNIYGMSIDDTTKHEMGHLIDYFFKKNGLNTYIQTIQTNDQASYTANYLINDADQYTRLNVLRGTIGAGPSDPPMTLLNKFLSQVKSGKINSDKFNFLGISSNKPVLTQKNNIQKASEVYKLLQKSIFVDGNNNHNIEQLFSNFGINMNGIVYVSFDLLAQLNLTSKDMERKYYFLKLLPK